MMKYAVPAAQRHSSASRAHITVEPYYYECKTIAEMKELKRQEFIYNTCYLLLIALIGAAGFAAFVKFSRWIF